MLLAGVLLPFWASGLRSDNDPLSGQRAAEAADQVLRAVVNRPLDSAFVNDVIEKARRNLAQHPRAKFIVLELDSPGGDMDAASALAEFLSTELKAFTTIAWIPPDRQVLAEGVLVALAAKTIVMGKDSRLGADLSRKDPAPAEAASLKEKLRRFAHERGYSPLITDAMVSKDHDDIYAMRFASGPDGKEEETRFKTLRDIENLTPEEKGLKRSEPKLVKKKGDLLVMSPQEALKPLGYGFTEHVANDLKELFLALSIAAGDESVIDVSHGPLKSENPAGQAVVNFLNSPFPRFLLILCGCLAFLIELKTLGTMIPGTIALACFTAFFAASSLPVTGSLEGTASLWEILLFVIGVALLAAEFLLLPGMAIFAVAGAAICAVSLVLAMVPADASALSSEQTMTDAVEEAVAILAYGFGAGSVCFLCLLRYLPRSQFLARRGLVSSGSITGVPTADSALAAQAAQATILGQAGTAATTLRPAGKVTLDDGRLLDVVAEGEFIEKGTRVKVSRCDGSITIVSRMEEPPGA